MVSSTKPINSIIGLPQFTKTLRDIDPITFKRVTETFRNDGHGHKLAFIPTKSRPEAIKSFAYRTQAEDRYIEFDGLEKYLAGVLQKTQHADLISILKPKERTPTQLPDFHNIKVLSTLVTGHPLAKFVTKQQPLFMEDFVALLRSGFIDLHILRKGDDSRTSFGILEASQGPSHGEDSAWTRDMAAVALGKMDIGQTEFAEKIATKLYEAYAQPSQRARINNLLSANPDHNNYPHTKFTIEAETRDNKIIDYKLVDYKGGWNMKQLDAYGYLLTLLGKLSCANRINIKELDEKTKANNSDFYKGTTESTLVALTRMLIKSKYWETSDYGAWEWPEHPQRASSIAACISGLSWVKQYFEQSGAFTNPTNLPINVFNDQGYTLEQFKKDLNEGIKAGQDYLFSNRIPPQQYALQGANAKELDEELTGFDKQLHHEDRHKDAALLFILALSDPKMIGEHGISPEQENSILRTVYDLMGDLGFKRYPTDEYMGMDWTLAAAKHKETYYPEHADNQATNYKPAEWCLFDPYLATHFYKKFFNSGGKDLESYLRADRHARRALAQITKSNYTIYKQGYSGGGGSIPGGEVIVPAGEAMEHYWYRTKDSHTGAPLEHGSWVAGENYRLNWTKIALQQMVYWGSKAGLIFKKEYPNGWDKQEITGLNLSMLGQKSKVGLSHSMAAAA